MYNKKVVLIVGFSRGGTNILWNILQSHPKICAPKHETGSILSYSKHLKFGRLYARLKKYGLADLLIFKKLVDYQLYRYKLENLTNENNKYRSENELYSRVEVSNAALCLKSVDDDIFITDELLNIYPDLHIICLIRNGYAIANGHKRRSSSIEETAELYCRVGSKMDDLSKKHHNVTTIKFEDVLMDPFLISKQLYQFISVKPEILTKLRFKSKKLLHDDDVHEIKYGEISSKYWLDKDEARQFLDPAINEKQIARLSKAETDAFNSIAAQQLRLFAYEII